MAQDVPGAAGAPGTWPGRDGKVWPSKAELPAASSGASLRSGRAGAPPPPANRRGARGVLAARRTPAAAPGAKPRGCEVLQCTLDLLAHIPLGHGLGHLPSSGSTSWALGVCVMVKRVSEMSERKVSRSKCCLPSGSSSSSPSSMGTTLQKSWLHHFSVGLQTSSSCMRWSQGARWAPCGGGVRARLPAVLPGSSRAPHSIYCPRAPYLVPWCLRKGESSIPSAGHLIPLGLSHPGAVICPVRGSTLQPSFPPHPLPQWTHLFRAGELSLAGRLSELEGEDNLCDPAAWRAPCQAGPGAGQRGAALRRGLVWPPQIHICGDTLGVWSEQSLQWWDQRLVVVWGCQHPAHPRRP